MNGCGNDYIFVYLPDNPISNPKELATKLSDRHFGIGSDGLVTIDKSPLAHCSMRIFNADGSEANMCGNALRCVEKYIYDRGLTDNLEVSVSTLAGVKTVKLFVNNGVATSAQADLGVPSIMLLDGKRNVNYSLAVGNTICEITPVELGNYHAVRFVKSLSDKEMRLAAAISKSFPFTDGINVEVAKVLDRQNIAVRVYERGSGITMACGTGAGATLFAAFLKGLTGAKVNIHLSGGVLEAEYKQGRISIKGAAALNFEGIIPDNTIRQNTTFDNPKDALYNNSISQNATHDNATHDNATYKDTTKD